MSLDQHDLFADPVPTAPTKKKAAVSDVLPLADDPPTIKDAIAAMRAAGKANKAVMDIRSLRVRHHAGVDVTEDAAAVVRKYVGGGG
jgi:RecJ-like exonuclease